MKHEIKLRNRFDMVVGSSLFDSVDVHRIELMMHSGNNQ